MPSRCPRHPLPRRRSFRKLFASCALAALATGGNTFAASPDAPAPARENSLATQVREWATQEHQTNLLAALAYNEKHLALLTRDPVQKAAARTWLATEGDAFSAHWLTQLAQGGTPPIPAADCLKLAAKITARQAEKPAVTVTTADWVWRAAVCDVLCNPLEMHLKSWVRQNLRPQLTDPASRSSLERLAALKPAPVELDSLARPQQSGLGEATLVRAAETARVLLNSARRP